MAETNISLLQTHQSNPILNSLFHALDPISLILHQNSDSDQPVPLRLTTESYVMERGPRYKAYAELRESKLRMKIMKQQEPEEKEIKLTPPRKQVKFQGVSSSGRKGSSVLTQSVPDFSAALRKENRKPVSTLPTMPEMTPPSKTWSKTNVVLSNSRGSKSANAGEKKGRGGGLMARKSYACVNELKGLSLAATNALNSENRGGRNSRVTGKTVFGYRLI
ncbi:Homeobox Hox-B3-like protein [Quillaja saponaria]|uniref:Homeobox Hox-B3-like protein n=1 Tax=Quillaja saponaria TaxID=32244 RepID=A0AAD7Q6H6_QUISA|nr:Homeobox Hox-B3-like protein [Quillaja saponaria]